MTSICTLDLYEIFPNQNKQYGFKPVNSCINQLVAIIHDTYFGFEGNKLIYSTLKKLEIATNNLQNNLKDEICKYVPL